MLPKFTVVECSESSVMLFCRFCAMFFPPFMMLASCVLGSLLGEQLKSHPTLFLAFISFGIVMLLYLVVNDLLVEAREAFHFHRSQIGCPLDSSLKNESSFRSLSGIINGTSNSNHINISNSTVSEGDGYGSCDREEEVVRNGDGNGSGRSVDVNLLSASWWTAISFFGGVYAVLILDATLN